MAAPPPRLWTVGGLIGGLQAAWQYDAFGTVTAEQRKTWLNPFTFAGNQDDEGSDLSHFQSRWYDPAVGRFLSQDPVAGFGVMPQTLNPYAYGVNNPPVCVDAGGRVAPGLPRGTYRTRVTTTLAAVGEPGGAGLRNSRRAPRPQETGSGARPHCGAHYPRTPRGGKWYTDLG